MADFNFCIPLKKDALGQDTLVGVASTVSIDRDDERMSENALQDMVLAIREKGVNLFGNHEHNWENTLGAIKEAELVNNQVMIKTTLDNPQTNPKVNMLLEKLKRGINLGLSVGGTVTKLKYEYSKELGKKIKVIDGVKLYEISVVGIPSNADSFVSIPQAITKSMKEKPLYNNRCNLCYGEIAKGVCTQCLKDY
jgi:HK97 family phage prohead protease